MSESITKADLKELGKGIREATKEDIKVLGKELKRDISRDVKDALREEMRVNTREIISHFNESQATQNEQLKEIKGQLDVVGEDVAKVKLAVLDLMSTDRHLHNLVRELQRQGIAIQTEKVFAA